MATRPDAADVLDHLGRSDRHEVIRAVRYGRAVDDPDLAEATVGYARSVQEAARSWRLPKGWLSLVDSYLRWGAWMLIPVGLVLAVWLPDPVVIAIEVFAVVVFVHGLVRHVSHAPALAAQSEVANLQLIAASNGEPVTVEADVRASADLLPWWRPRMFTRSNPGMGGWLPIPLRHLVAVWSVWAVLMIVLGLTASASVQFWAVIVVAFLWFEVERRLAEPVERHLGPEALRVRSFDVFRSTRGLKWSILFAALLALEVAVAWMAVHWFTHGVVGLSLGLLLIVIYRDLASRWRWWHDDLSDSERPTSSA